MFHVKIKNISSQTYTHGQKFSTLDEANEWVFQVENKQNNPWGKLERTIPSSEATPEEMAVALEIIPEVVDESPEMVRLPKTYEIEIVDITEQYQKEQRIKELEAIGEADRKKCEKVLKVIGGFNRERVLTFEQITEMQSIFANTEKALNSGRPDFALALISAITVDGVLVTQEMKDICLELLS